MLRPLNQSVRTMSRHSNIGQQSEREVTKQRVILHLPPNAVRPKQFSYTRK